MSKSINIEKFTVARANPKKSGYLTLVKVQVRAKVNVNMRQSATYYWILGEDALWYFQNETDQTPKGQISLKKGYMKTKELDPQKFLFQLCSKKDKSIILKADSKANMIAWVTKLQETQEALSNDRLTYGSGRARMEYTITVKVWEAQNLVNGKDMFATVLAENQTELARSTTVWALAPKDAHKRKNPYFYAEWSLPIEPHVNSINVEVRDLRKKQNFLIGTAEVPIRNKESGEPGSSWYPLKVSTLGDLEVYLHLDIKKTEQYVLAGNRSQDLIVINVTKVSKNLFSKAGCFIEGRHGPNFKFQSDISSTATWKNIQWTFDMPTSDEFIVLLVYDAQMPDCIGQVTLTRDDIENRSTVSLWRLKEIDGGRIRVDVKFHITPVLDDENYDELFLVLCEDNMRLVKLIAGNLYDRKPTRIAESLVRAFERRRTAVHYLKEMLREDISRTKDPNVIFKSNTLATKSFDIYLKLIALPHLHKMLTNVISDIYKRKKSCEMDETRLEPMDERSRQRLLAKNKAQLIDTLNQTLKAILGSTSYFPRSLRNIFEEMKKNLAKKFPGDNQVIYAGSSGFIFLRFICPAILGPALYGLQTEHAQARAARDLTLVAKTIQTLANLTTFNQNEAYMMPLNDWLEGQIPLVKDFLDQMASTPTSPLDEIPTPHTHINFGKEMACIVQYIQENLDQIVKGREEDDLVIRLGEAIDKLRDGNGANTRKTSIELTAPQSPSALGPWPHPSSLAIKHALDKRETRRTGKSMPSQRTLDWMVTGKSLLEDTTTTSSSKSASSGDTTEDKLWRATLMLHESIEIMRKRYVLLYDKHSALKHANREFVSTIQVLTEQKDQLMEELLKYQMVTTQRGEEDKEEEGVGLK